MQSHHNPFGQMISISNKRIFFPVLVISIFCVIFILWVIQSQHRITPIRSDSGKSIIHHSRMNDLQFYKQASEKSDKYKINVSGRIAGGIIPHHLLAAPLIAGFFEGIKDQDVKRVILIGPNHYNLGKATILVSNATWQTIFGELTPDTFVITNLLKENVAEGDEEVFETEHSIYGIVPFIKKIYPDAKVVPIILKSSTTKVEADKLIISLSKIMDKQTLVLASVDFSHYLPSSVADKYDKESISALESSDTDKILKLNPEKNFDSPTTLYILVKLMKMKKADKPHLIYNTNSAKLVGDLKIKETTSYVTMYYILDQDN